jgi:hypothetical protein
MFEISESLTIALQHDRGSIARSRADLSMILEVDPNHADA